MTLFHHNQHDAGATNASVSPLALNTATAASGKKRMSLFSFGLSSHSASSSPKGSAPPPLSTSPNTKFTQQKNLVSSPSASPVVAMPPRNSQLNSPVCSPVLETESLCDKPESNIFERSVQEFSEVKQEDCIPPALDATAQILGDKDTNLDDVEMVYSSRRNSSVIGLNMALGRPYTPLRKNSIYSMSQMHPANGNAASMSSLSHQPQSPISPPKLSSSRSSVSFYSYADMINNDEFSRRPSVMHSYSYGVVPTIGRKMSVTSNHSTASNGNSGLNGNSNSSALHFNKLSRKMTLNSITSGNSQSQLSKQLGKERVNSVGVPQRTPSKVGERESRNLNKFLISPESSDSEDQEVYYPATSNSSISKRKSFSSVHSNVDSESLISTSVGDCIRQCSTEISGH